MKKGMAVAFLFLAFSLRVGAAGFLNSTDGTIYFFALPVEAGEFQLLIDDSESLKQFISENFGRLEAVPPAGFYRNLPTYPQDTMLAGYVQYTGSPAYPIFAIIIRGSSEENNEEDFYEIRPDNFIYDGQDNLLTFSSKRDAPPRVDNRLVDGRIVDWLDIPDSLVFSHDFIPPRIRQREDGNSKFISINDSFFWKQGGAALHRVRTYQETENFYVMVDSFHEFTEGLSIFLHFYENKDEPGPYVIEVPVADMGGPVLLWSRSRDAVDVVGTYQHNGFFLEFFIEKNQLPDRILDILEGRRSGSVDLSSGFNDGRVFEDFLFGELPIQVSGK